jgi:hypothetical protein
MPPGGFANHLAGTLRTGAHNRIPVHLFEAITRLLRVSGACPTSWARTHPEELALEAGSCLKLNTGNPARLGAEGTPLDPNCNVIDLATDKVQRIRNQHRSRYHGTPLVMKNPATGRLIEDDMPWNNGCSAREILGSRSYPRWVHFPNRSDRYWNCALGD